MNKSFTQKNNFFGNSNPYDLIEEYGSPLYVYNEKILRDRCKILKSFVSYPKFSVDYSIKANNNLSLIKIIKSEGLNVDATSPGELYIAKKMGFDLTRVLFVVNNVTKEDLQYAIDNEAIVSVDSISQLIQYGQLNPRGRVCVRFNSLVGAGHSDKVVTGGKNTKFGVTPDKISDVKEALEKYQLKLVGINQHIGSLFLDEDKYIEGMLAILDIARKFEDIDFIDFGGGFGISYYRYDQEKSLDFKVLGEKIDKVLYGFSKEYGKDLTYKIEPGRYVTAESGVLLGNITSNKSNYDTNYIGSNIGFNILQRPMVYDSYHAIEVYKKTSTEITSLTEANTKDLIRANLVGNICESGDILARDRLMPRAYVGDVLGILDVGAYGYAMASSYNGRPRPAEVLISSDGNHHLIRSRESYEDLIGNCLNF